MSTTDSAVDSMEARILAGGFDGPSYLAGSQNSRIRKLPKLIEMPTFLSDDWDDETPLIAPELLSIEGGMPLLYKGESHSLSGAGGSGKSWVAQRVIAELVQTTREVGVYVDYEGNRTSFRERMKGLGVTKDQASRIAYWSVGSSLMQNTAFGAAWLAWIDEHNPSFVAVDSVSKACAAAGLNDEDNPQFQSWDCGVIVPLTMRRITSLRIDHTGHQSVTGSGGSRARGASAKKDAVSGAAYLFEVVDPWTRESCGSARLKVLKDRHGHHKTGAVVAIAEVQVRDSGAHVRIRFVAPASGVGEIEGAKKSLTAPVRVLRAVRSLNSWATKKEIQAWDAANLPLKFDGEPAGFLNADTCYKTAQRLARAGEIRESSSVAGTVFSSLDCDILAPDFEFNEVPF